MELSINNLEQICEVMVNTKQSDPDKSLAEILATEGSISFTLVDSPAKRVSSLYYDTFNHKVVFSIHK